MKWTIKKAETRILEVERKELPKGLTYWAAVDYLSKMRREGKYQKVTMCCVEGPACPIGFYEKCGFRRNGKDFEDEIGMERAL